MACYDLTALESAAISDGQAASDILFRLGLAYSTGTAVTPDRIAAHKWFNLAALRGNTEAVRCRKEIAAEMSETEVAAALKAAREWIRTH